MDDPTLMSGGLRASVGDPGLGVIDGGESGGLGRGGNVGDAEVVNYAGNGGTLKGLEGLRKGDALIERGVDRQSFVSGMLEGSRTTVSISAIGIAECKANKMIVGYKCLGPIGQGTRTS